MFRLLPVFGGDQRAVAEIVNGIMNGKTNNTGTVTLNTIPATSTVISDSRISSNSVVLLMPKNTLAAAEIPFLYITCGKGEATITHRTVTGGIFAYAVIG
jgi:hypothetical protein